ncbi:MAG: S8 family serine peptidase [Bacteroidales bacterium]|nr:S8 family serine peptidase [Bacteroidales bacterium]
MKSFCILLLYILYFSFDLYALDPVEGHFYWIEFKDKGNTDSLLLSPDKFLSSRALERRLKYRIPVTENDLPVNTSYLACLNNMGVTVIGVSKWLNGALIVSDDTARLGLQLDSLSFVKKYSARNLAKSKNKPSVRFEDCQADTVPLPDIDVNDTLYGKGWQQLSLLKGEYLHYNGFRGRGMTIAVIDEGFYGVDMHPAFDSLRNSGRLSGIRDFTGQSNSVFSEERSNHGSKVLSCMAANLPGELIGTAPDASYWLLSSEHSPEESPLEEYYWAFAAEFADSVGVDIITSSLGYALFDNYQFNYTYRDFYTGSSPASKAAAYAWSKGIAVVASAGNEGSSTWHYMLFPGETPSIITVGAINEDGGVSDFSSRGYPDRTVIKPEIVAPGENVYVVDGKNDYIYQRGTSFAAPLISGMIACCLQLNPLIKNDQLKKIIIDNSIFANKPNYCYGYGLPDFQKIMRTVRDY